MNAPTIRMNTITGFIQRIKKSSQVKVLGRWEITYYEPIINIKIDLANEDNCGICYSTKYHVTHNKILHKNTNPIIDLE